MPDDDVLVSVEAGVATVTLNRPAAYNAQTPAMWARLRDIGRALTGDVRVVVVRGAGRGFSAGLDTSVLTGSAVPGEVSFAELGALPADELTTVIAGYQEAFGWLRRPDLITVAAVHGHAVGAGFQLALACDMRILSDDAQFAMAETTLGLVPDLGGTKRLVELVGYGHALEICVTGRRVGAAEADSLGLATLAVPRDELETATRDLVAAVLAAPRGAVVETKALLLAATGHSFAEQEAAEREAQARRIADLTGRGE
ncbi:MAG TPA: enoyl-CoA hydratase/isomerase family protein [Actinocatenispora sp.]